MVPLLAIVYDAATTIIIDGSALCLYIDWPVEEQFSATKGAIQFLNQRYDIPWGQGVRELSVWQLLLLKRLEELM